MNPRVAALAALIASGGCLPRAHAPLPSSHEGEWASSRDLATRRAILYDGVNHRATATATHLSLSVREARARRLGEWLGWTKEELASRLARERAEAEGGEEFILSFYSASPQANDLDAPVSIWRVAVKVGSETLVASRVTSTRSDATVTGLFPYVGPFDVVYRVFLPRSASGPLMESPFVLEIASALGKLELDYGSLPEQSVSDPWQPVPPP